MKMKNKRFKPKSPPPTPPVPLDQQCDYKDDHSWMPKCPLAANFQLDHEEFTDDEQGSLPQFCSQHLGKAFLRLIDEPGCGIDELTIMRLR